MIDMGGVQECMMFVFIMLGVAMCSLTRFMPRLVSPVLLSFNFLDGKWLLLFL